MARCCGSPIVPVAACDDSSDDDREPGCVSTGGAFATIPYARSGDDEGQPNYNSTAVEHVLATLVAEDEMEDDDTVCEVVSVEVVR